MSKNDGALVKGEAIESDDEDSLNSISKGISENIVVSSFSM